MFEVRLNTGFLAMCYILSRVVPTRVICRFFAVGLRSPFTVKLRYLYCKIVKKGRVNIVLTRPDPFGSPCWARTNDILLYVKKWYNIGMLKRDGPLVFIQKGRNSWKL